MAKAKPNSTFIWVFIAFLMGLLINSGGRLFDLLQSVSSSKPSSTMTSGGELNRLNRLSLKLNAKFWRGLDKNDFSLYYEPVEPGTIRIKVRYKPNADLNLVRSVAYAAQELVVHIAEEDFGLSVATTIDLAPLKSL